MGISPDAKGPEIRKAYKTLALVLHPDKSTAPDAEVQFRYWYFLDIMYVPNLPLLLMF